MKRHTTAYARMIGILFCVVARAIASAPIPPEQQTEDSLSLSNELLGDGGCSCCACCNAETGACQNVCSAEECVPPAQFTPGKNCGALIPLCGRGACCPFGGGCADSILETDCLPPSTFSFGEACLQPNPPCGLPGCGSCQMHGLANGYDDYDCLHTVDDVLFVLNSYTLQNPNPIADLVPCDHACGLMVDVDDLLSEFAAFAGLFDCPHPCSPGACCFSSSTCQDQTNTNNFSMSETQCYLAGGTYCGDGTLCEALTCQGTTCVPFAAAGKAQELVPFSTIAQNMTGPTITLACQPVGSATVVGGQTVEIECRITTTTIQSFQGTQVDLPCSLSGGTAGAITSIGGTTNPDGDGFQGPGSGGLPFLFPIPGLGTVNEFVCRAAATVGLASPPYNLPAGQTRYLATFRYDVGDCATGEFVVVPENFTVPSAECDGTKLRDADRNLIPFDVSPAILTATPRPYGDVVRSGIIDVDDISCVLVGFSTFADCLAGDVTSPKVPCTPDGMIDVDDILAILDAFSGLSTCPGACE